MNEGMTSCGKPSRGRYVQGCRCYMCRVANADYARKNAHDKGSRHTAMVGPKKTREARAKVNGWMADGVPLREISRATGIGRSALRTLLKGEHPNAARFNNGNPKASRRMSRKNYDAIMGCERPSAPGAATLVDAAALNRALAWLDAHGVTRSEVAKASGIPLGTVYNIGRGEKCEHITMARLAAAAEELKRQATEVKR